MPKNLPSKPNLESLKCQSKKLLRDYNANNPEALARIQNVQSLLSEVNRSKMGSTKFTLVDAQFVVAREYGFKSWRKLKEHVESLHNPNMTFHKFPPGDRKILTNLFDKQKNRCTTIKAILDGQLGSAVSDSITQPHVALINSGPVKIFGGDPKHPAALELVKKLSQGDVVCTDDNRWKELIMGVFVERAVCINQLVPSSENISSGHLESIIRNAPHNLEIIRMGAELCSKLDEELFDYEQYGTVDSFIKKGIGFCGIIKGSVVCTAYSLRSCNSSIDIMTGFAGDLVNHSIIEPVAATLVSYCMEKNIEPVWLPVFNTEKAEESRKIAENLGYSDFEPHAMYVITGKTNVKRAYWTHEDWVEVGTDE